MSTEFTDLEIRPRTRMPQCGAILSNNRIGAMFRLSAEASRQAKFLQGKRMRIQVNREKRSFRLIEGDTGPMMTRSDCHYRFSCIELVQTMKYKPGQVFKVRASTIDGVKGVNFTPVEGK